jgi:hypothetical protein
MSLSDWIGTSRGQALKGCGDMDRVSALRFSESAWKRALPGFVPLEIVHILYHRLGVEFPVVTVPVALGSFPAP